MKINKTIMMACIASFCTLSLVTGCSSDTIDETPGDSNHSNDETTYLDGYAHPDGVIILNQGARVSQNSTITYISPEGTIEENSYKKVNGTAFGNEAQEFMYDIIKGKLNWKIDRIKITKSLSRIKCTLKNLNDFDIKKVHPLLIGLYSDKNLRQLYMMRNQISKIRNEDNRIFLKLALSQTLHKVALHPIAIPYISRKKKLDSNLDAFEKFYSIVNKMLYDIDLFLGKQYLPAKIFLHDSRIENSSISDNACNICVTSPPYLNNLDYGEISKVHTHFFEITNDWNDITQKVRSNLVTGSTTHYKISDFNMDEFEQNEFSQKNKAVFRLLRYKFNEIIASAKSKGGNKSFEILMMFYFRDMYFILKEIRRVVRSGGRSYLILGDSAPYGVFLPTTEILGKISKSVGFSQYRIVKLRTRGTKWRNLKFRHNMELSENVLILE